MNHQTELHKYERWLVQLCQEQRTDNEISVVVEQYSSSSEEYMVHFSQIEDFTIINSKTVKISPSDVEERTAGQKLLSAIREV